MVAHDDFFSQLKPNRHLPTNEHYLLPHKIGWKLGRNILIKELFTFDHKGQITLEIGLLNQQ